ncbi:MAG TPA: VanW family protein [Candidatus Paceibacterota bacterium]|nr:VanW family protein [Candidatus Paceibacterota bacterium]
MIAIRSASILGKALVATAVVVCSVVLSGSVYAWYLGDRIAPNTWIGEIPVGGMTREDAANRVQETLDTLMANGVRVSINGFSEVIRPENIGFDLNIGETVERAFARGHTGGWLYRSVQRVLALANRAQVDAAVRTDPTALENELSDIAILTTSPRLDIRLHVSGTVVTLLTDVRPGRTIDFIAAASAVNNALRQLNVHSLTLALKEDLPRANPATAPEALAAARRMMARGLTLQYEDAYFTINRDRIGSWIVNEYKNDQLVAGLDQVKIAQYVADIATRLYTAPEPPRISTENGRIVGFTPATVGRAVSEDELIALITITLDARAAEGSSKDLIAIPMKTTKIALTGLDAEAGITELIGTATTPFTGSPKNRISNIKNGVRFLSGTVVKPGEEFSTLGTLGTIDNTTGYLPELVIKGDRTIPEYGGGLCQVSTTLFRAALDAGMPITARRNHSYRVSYYEKDGDGHYIGPGLDATIYEPDLDFRFRNDTANSVLIIGYVIGDKLTFEFYGTSDGRTSKIIGPKLLSETASGDPIYVETTEIPVGTTKQIETAHPGGHATATYMITYSDGEVSTQVFESWYRRWPAQYLIGVSQLSSPTPEPSPTTTPAP